MATFQTVNNGESGSAVRSKLNGNFTAIANVDNTSDANKPVSTAAQAALDLKLSANGATWGGNGLVLPAVSADGSYNATTFGPANKFAVAFNLGTYGGVQDRVLQFGYRPNSGAGDGDVSFWWQLESDYNGGSARKSEFFPSWYGPTGVARRAFFGDIDLGTTKSPSSGKAEGYTRIGLNAHELWIGANPSGLGFPNGWSFFNDVSSGNLDITAQPTIAGGDSRIRLTHSNGSNWIGLTAGSGGSLGISDQAYSLDLVGAAGSHRDFFIRRSTNAGSSYTNVFRLDNANRWLFGDAATDGVHKYQFDSAVAFAGTNVTGSIYKAGYFNTDSAGSEILIGRNGSDPAIWFKGAAGSPSGSNFSIIAGSSDLYFNASTGVNFRIGNQTWAGVKDGCFFVNYDPSAVSTGGGANLIYVGNATGIPGSNPTGGFLLYSDSGVAKVRQSDGLIGSVVVGKTPSSASDTGVAGTVAWDASYVYVCTATNTWKRAAIATW